MENWEVQEMKDDLVNLGYELKGTRESKTLKKAFDYINDLEKRIFEIAKDEDRAIKLLKENGYAVIKKTKGMLLDEKECERMSNNGEDKECLGCNCSICISNY